MGKKRAGQITGTEEDYGSLLNAEREGSVCVCEKGEGLSLREESEGNKQNRAQLSDDIQHHARRREKQRGGERKRKRGYA